MKTLKAITSALVIWSTMFAQLFGESNLCYDYGMTEIPPSRNSIRPMMKVTVIPTGGGVQATLISYSVKSYDVTKLTETVIDGSTNNVVTFDQCVSGWSDAHSHGGVMLWKDICNRPDNYMLVRMWLIECGTSNIVAYGQARIYSNSK